MSNKVLIIHPDNECVEFPIYQTLYKGKPYTIVDNPSIADAELRKLIEEHDVIVILGCFLHEGLLAKNIDTGKDFLLIDDTHVELLKRKIVYSISGKRYFEERGVPGLHTGTILTSGFEATLYEVEGTEEEIVNSALRLMTIIGDTLNIPSTREKRAKIFAEYNGIDPISIFNKKEIIAL